MITILMPIYNGIEFLEESIGSVLAQSYSDWELLIGMNGLSMEAEQTVINKIKNYNDGRIVGIAGLDKGKSKTLNTLVGMASGEIICLLDADDIWLPTKLEKQLPLMSKYDIVGTHAQYFGDRNDEPPIFLGKLSKDMFSFQNPLINSSIMLKKQDAYWEEEWEVVNDYDLYIRMLENHKSFFNLPEILIKHRIYPTSNYANRYDEFRVKIMERLPKLSQGKLADLGQRIHTKRWIV